MKNYFKHFRIIFIVVAVMLVIFIGIKVANGTLGGYKRTNNNAPAERVYDYADKLTDEEENKLRALIAKKENEIGCDIVLVTIADPSIDSDYAMMNYADDFYDDNQYGYDVPWGDGALYLDNWARDVDPSAENYCWFSTCGRVERKYSTSDINWLIDDVCRTVNKDPYGAYVTYVNSLSRTMSGKDDGFPESFIWMAAIFITVVYIICNVINNKGKKTTKADTYISRVPHFHDRRDIFLSKHTTTRHIQRSSGGGGGGGGHHISSGGHSHGGGGGRH